MGATPNGLIDENGMVEIKCPQSAEHLTAEEVIEKLSSWKGVFLIKRNLVKLNQKHRYF